MVDLGHADSPVWLQLLEERRVIAPVGEVPAQEAALAPVGLLWSSHPAKGER